MALELDETAVEQTIANSLNKMIPALGITGNKIAEIDGGNTVVVCQWNPRKSEKTTGPSRCPANQIITANSLQDIETGIYHHLLERAML